MKVVVVEIRSASDGQVVSGTLCIERQRSGSWFREELITVVSGQPGARRELLLDDTQRVVVEGTSSIELVYDRNQSAAVPRATGAPPPKPSPVSTDGDESPDIAGGALAGEGFAELQAQERRDAAISAARAKLKETLKPPAPEPVPEPESVALTKGLDEPVSDASHQASALKPMEPREAGPRVKI